MISEASVGDVPRAVALLNEAFDDRLSTVAGLRHRFETRLPEEHVVFWKAELRSEIVGWAVAGLDAFSASTGAAFAGIVAHPEYRGRGIGRALREAVSDHLDRIEARRVLAQGRADVRSVAFARASGFELAATDTTSAVDPRTVGRPGTRGDVEVVPMSAYLDDPEPVFEADRESAMDEPGPHDFSGITFESWRRLIWAYPDCDHDLGAVAVVEGRVVGTTFLFSDRERFRAVNAGTGVIAACRGRGLGLLLKQHSLARAAAAGIVQVVTQNDATNAPMLAINERLGYRPLATAHTWLLER